MSVYYTTNNYTDQHEPARLGLNQLDNFKPVADNFTSEGVSNINIMECVKVVDFALLETCPNL